MNNGQPDENLYGCVIFDDAFEHQSGYAAKAGEKARRITGTRDLDSDRIWVTNLSFDQIIKSGFSKHARFRHEGFLRVPIDRILNTHNVVDGKESAEMIATLADRVSQIAYSFCNIGFAPGTEIKQMVRQSFKHGTDPVMSDWICSALKDATSYYTFCEKPVNQFLAGADTSDIVTFQVHPMFIAKNILSLDLPYGVHWEKVDASRLNPAQLNSFEALHEAVGGPFLAKTKITNIDPNFNSLLNFGSMPAFQGQRRWLASTELEALFGLAKLEIQELIIPKDHSQYLLPYYEKLLELPDICQASLSFRLFMDNLWCAAGTNFKPAIYRALSYNLINPATPFVRSLEREICMNTAYLLTHHGFEVLGYGSGFIKVKLNGESPEQILAAAKQSNTIPPMCPNANVVEKIDSPMVASQLQYLNAQTKLIMDFDKQIIGKVYTHAN